MIWKSLKHLIIPSHQNTPPTLANAEQIYQQIVKQARLPFFYTDCHVTDTPLGHFDMIALHLFLALQRICHIQHHDTLSQTLLNVFIDDIEANLHAMENSQIKGRKNLRLIAQTLYSRLDTYRTVFDKEPQRISEVITRNVFRARQISPHAVSSLIGYFFLQAEFLAKQSNDALLNGRIAFSPPQNQNQTL